MYHRLISIGIFDFIFWFAASPFVHGQDTVLPPLSEVVSAKRDLWGEASLNQPNGPSYEFFRDLLPPPRYVRVGPDEFLFGGFRERVNDPVLANGYLPIVEIQYTHPSPVQSEGAVPLKQEKVQLPQEIYRLEAFASTEPGLAEHGVVFAKFDLAKGASGYITVQLDKAESLKFEKGAVKDSDGQVLAVFDSTWTWERVLRFVQVFWLEYLSIWFHNSVNGRICRSRSGLFLPDFIDSMVLSRSELLDVFSLVQDESGQLISNSLFLSLSNAASEPSVGSTVIAIPDLAASRANSLASR